MRRGRRNFKSLDLSILVPFNEAVPAELHRDSSPLRPDRSYEIVFATTAARRSPR